MCFGWRLWTLIILPPILKLRSEEIKRKQKVKEESHAPKTCFQTVNFHHILPQKDRMMFGTYNVIKGNQIKRKVFKSGRHKEEEEYTNDGMLVERKILLLLLSIRGGETKAEWVSHWDQNIKIRWREREGGQTSPKNDWNISPPLWFKNNVLHSFH